MTVDDNKILIDQLLPHRGTPEFDSTFAELTLHMTKSSSFLLKMELNRLSAPCMRAIDLRGKVDSECFEYPFGELIHYLDDDAISTFEATTALYNDYTVGVYEAVTNAENSYRAIQQKKSAQILNDQLQKQQAASNDPQAPPEESQAERRRYPAEEVLLNSQFHRSEERLKIILTIKIRLDTGRTIHCQTLDLSRRGVKIKLPARYEIEPEDALTIHFLSLAQEYDEPGVNREISYKVVNKTISEDSQQLNLERQHKVEDFDLFLSRYLTQQRPATKVDARHLLEAIKSAGYQQLHLNNLNGLPIYFQQDEDNYKATIALCNNTNRHILEYWQGQSKLQRIASLFSPQRLSTIAQSPGTPSVTNFYCFTHVAKGKRFFYSATLEELQQSGMTDLYFAFGALKKSWRVYQFHWCDLQPDHWQLRSVLPNHLHQPEPLAEQYTGLLNSLSQLGYLVDITDESSRQLYRQRPLDRKQINALQQFGHTTQGPQGLQLVEMENQQQRREARFDYQTQVILSAGGESVVGHTVGFSVHGLQINLTTPFKGNINTMVKLALPNLQKIAKNLKLDGLNYQVLRISPNMKVLHLKIEEPGNQHQGAIFFQRLIKLNNKTLSPQLAPPLAFTRSLNLLLSNHLCTLPLFINKEKMRYRIAKLARPFGHNRLFNLFEALSENYHEFDLYPLAKPKYFKQLFSDPLLTMDKNSPSQQMVVFIQLTVDKNNNYQCISKLVSEFEDIEEQREFILEAQKSGQFYAVKIFLNKTERMSTKALYDELLYAASQSLSQTRRTQEELDSILAVAELIDISNEISECLEIKTPQHSD